VVAAFADGNFVAAWTSGNDGDALGTFAQRLQPPLGD
jgi:hypothetical protein